jgi:high-affinity iron transporter
MDFTSALPTFVITLREGVEAVLVVGIVLAYLKKSDRTNLYAWVFSGVAVGLLISLLIGVLFNGILARLATSESTYAPVIKEGLEALFSVVAIAFLSWMLIWMTQQAKQLKASVEGTLATALEQSEHSEWGVFGLVAIAVLREGFETVLFLAATFQQGWVPLVGAIAGLLGAVGIGVGLFQLGIKINLRQFFQVMGVLLLLIVSGLVVTALRHGEGAIAQLAQINPTYASWCPPEQASCILGAQVWNLSQVLPDRQFPGILLKSFFGYTQRLYSVQAIAYVMFLGTVGTLYFRSLTGWRFPQSSVKQKSQV